MEISIPRTLEAALDELRGEPETRLLAGGTDLMVAINFGRERPERIMATRQLEELRELRVDGSVRLGAGVPYSRMERELARSTPALAQAARTIGSPQIRNAGTVGGNLGTCSPAGDTLPVLAALDAQVVVRSSEQERRVPFTEFMRGPRKPDLRPGELVVAVEWEPAGPAQSFLKAGTRNAMVISVAMLALVIDRQARKVRAGIGSVAPTIIRPLEAEAFAEGLLDELGWDTASRPTEAAAIKFGELAAQATRPIDDVRGTIAYRRHIVKVMAARALARTAELA